MLEWCEVFGVECHVGEYFCQWWIGDLFEWLVEFEQFDEEFVQEYG